MSEWKKYKLGELAYSPKKAIISGPFGSNIGSRFFVKEGIPVIRGNNLPNDMRRFNDEGFVFLTEEKAEELNCYAIKDDLLFTAAGTIGQVGILTGIEKYKKYVISNKQIRVRLNTQIVNPLYAYYWFSSDEMNEFIKNRNTGSTIPLINLSVIKELPINLPNLRVQNTIVEILSSLDDKIELNNKINQELENLAQTLFKRWFIDFEFPNENGEPYKSSGGEMEESELGEIPKGWKVKNLKEISICYDNKRVPLSSMERNLRHGEFPYYGAASLMDYVDDFLFDGIYVLMGEDGSVTDKNGFPVLQYVFDKFWVNNHAHVLQGKSISTELLLCLLKNTNVSDLVTGAVQPKLNQANMNKISMPLPNDLSKIDLVEASLNSIFEIVRLIIKENFELNKLRDNLLPKLISGELELSQIQTTK